MILPALLVPIAPGGAASVAAKKAPACAGNTRKAAIKAIEATFEIVMNGADTSHTLDEKFALIDSTEDPAFRDVLDGIAATNAEPLLTVGVVVQQVTCTGKRSADVSFEITVGGEPERGLAPAGSAVLDGGVWKLTQATACNLVALADPTLLELGPCATALATRT